MNGILVRVLATSCLAAMLLQTEAVVAQAQDKDGAASLAAEYEERFRRLNQLVEDLSAAQATLQKRIASLADRIQTLREENTRALTQSQSQFVRYEDLRQLAEEIKKIDQRREEDRRLILDEIRKLAQAPIVAPAPEPPRRPKPPEPAPTPAPTPTPAPVTPAVAPAKGYEHVVKERETISAIVAAYQQSGVKVTVAQVLKANPGLNPNRIPVGKKIFIPEGE